MTSQIYGIDFIDLWWVLWNRFVVGALYSKDSRWWTGDPLVSRKRMLVKYELGNRHRNGQLQTEHPNRAWSYYVLSR